MMKTAAKVTCLTLMVGQETYDQVKFRPWIVLDELNAIRYMGATKLHADELVDGTIYAGKHSVVHADDIAFRIVR
jgi:hypothetical protein